MKLLPSALILLAACEPTPTPVVAPSLASCLTVRTEPVVFQRQSTDEIDPERRIRLTNTCDAVLSGLQVRIEGPDRRVFELLAPMATLGPLEASPVRVVFVGDQIGRYQAQIQVSYPEAARVEQVGLEGVVLGTRIVADPSRIDLGQVRLGCPVETRVELVNAGTVDFRVGSVEAVDLPELSLTNTRARLDADGGQAAIGVQLETTTPGSWTGSLRILDDEASLATEVPVTVEVMAEVEHVDFDILPKPEHDVLFTFERGGGNTDVNDDLADAIPDFVASFADVDASLRLAAVVADDGCVVGTEPWIDDRFAASDARAAFTTMLDASYAVAPYGSRNEKGFEQVRAHAGASCGAGFWREDATWHTVHVANGPEESGISGEDQATWFEGLRGDPDQAFIHAVVGPLGGCRGAAEGLGYLDAVRASGGLEVSWCSTAADQLNALVVGIDPDPPLTPLQLTRTPVVSTLVVRFNGVSVPDSRWSYDAESREIRFVPELRLRPGSIMEAAYSPQAECE